MGKLVLAIIAVIVVQLAFTAYMASDGSGGRVTSRDIAASVSNANPVTVSPDSTRLIDPIKSTVPLAAVTADTESRIGSSATNALNIANVDLQRASEVPDRRAGKQDQLRQSRPESRRPLVRFASVARSENEVRREYFGSLVVERRFGLYNSRSKNISKFDVGRQYFGRMVVEITSNIKARSVAKT